MLWKPFPTNVTKLGILNFYPANAACDYSGKSNKQCRCLSELNDSTHGSWDYIWRKKAMTCSPYIFLHSTSYFCLASLLLHSTIHFPIKRSRKNHEEPVTDIEHRLDQYWGGWDSTDQQGCLFFLPHDSSGAENRIMMFQDSILFVCLDPRKEPSVQALFFLWLAMLIYLSFCTPQEVCECSWLPQTSALGQHKHLFHADLRTESIPYSTPLSFLFTHSIPFANCSHDPLSPVSLLPGDLHVSWSSSQKTVRK